MGPSEWRKSVEVKLGRRMTKSERQCIGKAKMSQLGAESTAERLRRTRSGRYKAYQCRHCEHWHVGRKKIGS